MELLWLGFVQISSLGGGQRETHKSEVRVWNTTTIFIQGILSVDLLTFSKYLTKTILLFNDNIGLIQILVDGNVFTICIYITICELLIYFN